MLGSLAAFYHVDLNLDDPEQRRMAAIRLLAKVPTIAAACYRHSIGWPGRYPRNNLDYVNRFLHMMFEVPSEPLQLNPVAAKALDLLFILHADHEQNASTRSEEHTSELQSLMRNSYAVFCLKKKKTTDINQTIAHIKK